MHGTPSLVFCTAAVRRRIFTRAAVTARIGARSQAYSCSTELCQGEHVLPRSTASRRNSMRVARSL